MFDNLMESDPKKGGLRGTAATSFSSIAAHVVIIGFAVVATMKTAEEASSLVSDTTMVFIQDQEEEEPPPPELLDLPPPKGFRTLAAPINVPTSIPAIDLNQQFDPRDFSGVGVEEGIFEGIGDAPVDLAQIFNEAVVDEPPERISSPPLEYPRTMQQAGVEGMVVLQAVIDTSGRVERGSIEVVQSTNAAFESAARRLLERSLFRPGRVRGRPVRVLIQLPIQFTLIGGDR